MKANQESVVIRTIRLKVKPDSVTWLNKAAREVNFVWNWANETSGKAVRRYSGEAKWLGAFDLNRLSTGASACFERIGSDTIQRVNGEFVQKRIASKKAMLRWRKSGGSRRSLGWVPFQSTSIKRRGNAVRFCGKTIRVFEAFRLNDAKWRAGCFAQDAMGEWWLCLPAVVRQTDIPAPLERVGIDLGLKAIATTSDGEVLDNAQYYRRIESRISDAQKRGHRMAAKRLSRKAARQRRDTLHKFTRGVVDRYQEIIIGDVSAPRLVKTSMAKSVLDAGWAMLRTQLQYKGQQAGRRVEVVNESNTTRACSSCGSLSGPSGLRHLVVRAWQCADCGAVHDRDVNAARNIAKLAPRSSASICGNKAGVMP